MTDSPKPTLLIVEDEPLLLQLAVMTMETSGMHILEAGNVEEALRQISAVNHIDVLLTDIQMPGKKDGLDLATVVRDRFPECAIVLMSGRSLPTDRPLPANARYISKPWSMDRLEAIVADTVSDMPRMAAP